MRIKITDGLNWVIVSPFELQILLNERLVHACSEDCPNQTFHPMYTIGKVEHRLKEIRNG